MAKNKQESIKCDTSQNWAKATFIPKLGEYIIYSDLNKLKIGDGKTSINNLPYIDSNELYNGNFSIQMEGE